MVRDINVISGTRIDDFICFAKFLWKQKPKLLEQVRHVARARHLSHKTEDVYHNFIKRFILFHNKKARHPKFIAELHFENFDILKTRFRSAAKDKFAEGVLEYASSSIFIFE